jgi:hypothetical protein
MMPVVLMRRGGYWSGGDVGERAREMMLVGLGADACLPLLAAEVAEGVIAATTSTVSVV